MWHSHRSRHSHSRFVKAAEAVMNTEKEIDCLRTAVVVRASQLEKIERHIADGGFDATTRRGALKLLRTAVSAEKHDKRAA
jgi:hypothetical protein